MPYAVDVVSGPDTVSCRAPVPRPEPTAILKSEAPTSLNKALHLVFVDCREREVEGPLLGLIAQQTPT
jgi:hypothetical protein